ncbi:MAG: methionyl-tRNA formyltransferase [Phycisphaerae bacterium]
MALVTQLERIAKDRPKVHKPTHGTYFSFVGDRDKRYFVLETYGTCDREFPEKVSQSVQLDEQGAAQLIRILREEFPNLA